MTVDEAIICLSDMKIKIAIPKAAVQARLNNDALDMAIEALRCSEIPNNSDTISRQQAIDFVGSMNMCDEISNEAYEKLTSYLDELPSTQPETNCSEIPNNCPAADVVPVVRCDDCVYYGSRRWCELHSSVFDDNAFCSYGERKAGEQE